MLSFFKKNNYKKFQYSPVYNILNKSKKQKIKFNRKKEVGKKSNIKLIIIIIIILLLITYLIIFTR